MLTAAARSSIPSPHDRASGTSGRCPSAPTPCASWPASSSPSGSPSAASPTAAATPGQVLDIAAWAVPFGIVGGRLYHVITTPQPYFGEGGDPSNALSHLGGRPRHLGRRRARRRRRLDRLPPHGVPLPATSPTRRPRPRRRPGDRPLRQLVQPRALRPPDRPAVGPARSTSGTRRRPRRPRRQRQPGRARHLPPDVPLRVALVPRCSRGC